MRRPRTKPTAATLAGGGVISAAKAGAALGLKVVGEASDAAVQKEAANYRKAPTVLGQISGPADAILAPQGNPER